MQTFSISYITDRIDLIRHARCSKVQNLILSEPNSTFKIEEQNLTMQYLAFRMHIVLSIKQKWITSSCAIGSLIRAFVFTYTGTLYSDSHGVTSLIFFVLYLCSYEDTLMYLGLLIILYSTRQRSIQVNIFFLFLHENICSGYPLGVHLMTSHNMFLWRNLQL